MWLSIHGANGGRPRAPVNQAALGVPHERVTFPTSDGVRLSGWYVPPRNGAVIALVHGGGGDREGTILHARMLAKAGYGVLLYDARGRGESQGHENAAGSNLPRRSQPVTRLRPARASFRFCSCGPSVDVHCCSAGREESHSAPPLYGPAASK